MISKLECTKNPPHTVLNNYKSELENLQRQRMNPPSAPFFSDMSHEQRIMQQVIGAVGVPFDPATHYTDDGSQMFQICADGHRAMIKVMEYIQAQLNIEPFKGDKWAQIYYKAFVIFGRDGLMKAGNPGKFT